MPIYLDDHPLDIAADSLGDALDAAGRELHAKHRLIVEVQLDGERIPGDRLREQRSTALEGKELRLHSADPRELAADAIRQARLLLSQAAAAQSQAADLLQQDDPAQALERISLAMSAWQQAQQAVLNGSLLVDLDLDAVTFDDTPITTLVNDLLAQFQQLKKLITDNDTLALADALAYEWPATTDRWDQLMAHLADAIEAAPDEPRA